MTAIAYTICPELEAGKLAAYVQYGAVKTTCLFLRRGNSVGGGPERGSDVQSSGTRRCRYSHGRLTPTGTAISEHPALQVTSLARLARGAGRTCSERPVHDLLSSRERRPRGKSRAVASVHSGRATSGGGRRSRGAGHRSVTCGASTLVQCQAEVGSFKRPSKYVKSTHLFKRFRKYIIYWALL